MNRNNMEDRVAITHSQRELANYVHTYFPKISREKATKVGVSLYRFCENQDHVADYNEFRRLLDQELPADQSKTRVPYLFKKLFPEHDGSPKRIASNGHQYAEHKAHISRTRIVRAMPIHFESEAPFSRHTRSEL